MKTFPQTLNIFALSVLFLVTASPLWASAQSPFSCESLFPASSLTADSQTSAASTRKARDLIAMFENGSTSFSLADGLARTVRTESKTEQKSWMTAMGRSYRQLPKKHANPMKWTPVSPRRLIDRAFMMIRNLHLDFESSALENISPVVTYSRFLKEQSSRFESNYDFNEVAPVLNFVQSELVVLSKSSQKKNAVPFEAFLGGSFVNGKAKLETSDIDFSITDPVVQEASEKWSPMLNRLMKEIRPESNLTTEIHSAGAEFYGTLNPIVIRVTAETVELWVFPPAIDQGPATLRPATPQRYRLPSPL